MNRERKKGIPRYEGVVGITHRRTKGEVLRKGEKKGRGYSDTKVGERTLDYDSGERLSSHERIFYSRGGGKPVIGGILGKIYAPFPHRTENSLLQASTDRLPRNRDAPQCRRKSATRKGDSYEDREASLFKRMPISPSNGSRKGKLCVRKPMLKPRTAG